VKRSKPLHIFIFIVAMFFVPAIDGCKKDPGSPGHGLECEKHSTAKITDQRVLDNFFKPGSYWVYADPFTNKTDTMKLSRTLDTLGFEMRMTSGCDTLQHIELTAGLTSSAIKYELLPDNIFVSFSNQEPAAVLLNSITYQDTIKKVDSMDVGGVYYKRVVQSRLKSTIFSDRRKLVYYFVEKVGIIRIDAYTGSNNKQVDQLNLTGYQLKF
jgi:hypothetical protein